MATIEHPLSDNIDVETICRIVTRRAIQERCGVAKQTVSGWVVTNTIPAQWWTVIRELCLESGIPCPEHLFSFVPPKNRKVSAGSK